MIKNDQQYKITLDWIEKFKQNLDAIKNDDTEMHPLFRNLQGDSVESMIKDLENQTKEYREARDKTLDIGSILEEILVVNNLANNLVKLRIYLGLTQDDLAKLVNKKQQQIQRWEAEDYAIASLFHIREIFSAMYALLSDTDKKKVNPRTLII